ncbi:DUF4365 domain-containing protein [Amycolatopsis saalfeldensis]|nr:DUF4365 domain-containing protein [Amycolatopsis saalfeldensis]
MERMQRPQSAATERIGVDLVALAVSKHLGWLFREQPVNDVGIDAHVEIVENSEVIPRLLAVQIKSGLSFFDQPVPDGKGWWFRPSDAHVKYWTNHVLPVVVVLVNPETDRIHWQIVTSDTLQKSSRGGWKLRVPEDNILDSTARQQLRALADGDPYVLRVRELQLAQPWMQLLTSGQRLLVSIDEWMHKSSGRGSITLSSIVDDSDEPEWLADWEVGLGSRGYDEAVPRLFAWADVSLHEYTYDNADYDLYEQECVRYDNEGDRHSGVSFGDWQQGRVILPGLRPYSDDGEIAYWRLELSLNALGTAFLLVHDFATHGDPQLITKPS